jgi:hypothetical protein
VAAGEIPEKIIPESRGFRRQPVGNFIETAKKLETNE